jgi:D-3-phosphoglycerate dehydrogenase
MNILVTCPPMLGMIDEFIPYAKLKNINLIPAKVNQILSEEELIDLLPHYDGWIIGDDPATRKVFQAGKSGNLKAAVKWGIGVDNVDFDACNELKIPIINTPKMFGAEVADVALGYIIGLARQTFFIDREIRLNGTWPKPAGISLANKKIGIIGLGDIGRNLAKKLNVCDMIITGYDPFVKDKVLENIDIKKWPENIDELDFLVFTCSLNIHNRHMLNSENLSKCKSGVYIINVARGPLIDELALTKSIISGKVAGAALDVFEIEPLDFNSPLKKIETCILGSHNGSNTIDAVRRASIESINILDNFLKKYETN